MGGLNDILELMRRYCENVEKGYQVRWKKLPVELYDSETYEVFGGLMARQATLTTYLALSPPIWNGHIAPLILRSMTDAHITLSWILNDPSERAKKYILYGLGQEKLLIEHYKAHPDNQDKDMQEMIEMKSAWLNSQRQDYSIEVNVGNWTEGPSVRQMAQECGCEELYKFVYTPCSGATHNMWQHTSTHNLKPCMNPLHKYHKVPDIIEIPSDPDYVYRSARYVSKSYAAIDKAFGLSIKVKLPEDFFIEEMEKINAPMDGAK